MMQKSAIVSITLRGSCNENNQEENELQKGK